MPNNHPETNNSISPELEVALVLLEKARQDLIAVQKWLADSDISDEIMGFHIQQAIEKSLKAVLSSLTIDYPRTHNLRLLVDLCINNGVRVPAGFLQVDIFNRFAVQWRYDLLPSTPYLDFDRESAYDLAHRVWLWADKLLKNEVP